MGLTGTGPVSGLSYGIPTNLVLVEASLSQSNASVAGATTDSSKVDILRTAAVVSTLTLDDGDYHANDDTFNDNYDTILNNAIGIRAQLGGQGGGGARISDPVLTLRFKRRGA
jgi:hypothetical protein